MESLHSHKHNTIQNVVIYFVGCPTEQVKETQVCIELPQISLNIGKVFTATGDNSSCDPMPPYLRGSHRDICMIALFNSDISFLYYATHDILIHRRNNLQKAELNIGIIACMFNIFSKNKRAMFYFTSLKLLVRKC